MTIPSLIAYEAQWSPHGGILLNTSNKTELALGYAILYGDMAGTLCPIADLTKPQVVTLARWIKSTRGLIPSYTLKRPPSAELRPGQVDPFDYDQVAPALERLVALNRSDQAMRRSEHNAGTWAWSSKSVPSPSAPAA
jgi:NAD+ synthetase